MSEPAFDGELLNCIQSLVREATISEDDKSDGEGMSRGSSDDDLESNEDYQALMHQVEEKLLQFLEEQMKVDNEERSGGESDSGSSPNHQPEIDPKFILPIRQKHAYPCPETYKILPPPPEDWPQRPVMIRPTPGTSTRIRGIRYASEKEYKYIPGFCAGCILPINTGKEEKGKALVIDFESSHFVGTFMMRIKDIPSVASTTASKSETNEDYFNNRKRRLQGIVKGKFKTPLRMSECVTGQVFSRRAGKLPAQWIVSSFIKFVSTLAPQLEATIEGHNPRFLVPLAATAQTVIAKPHTTITKNLEPSYLKVMENELNKDIFNYSFYDGSTDIDEEVEEPHPADSSSIMHDAHRDLGVSLPSKNSKSSISTRMKLRKKAFNSVSAKKSEKPCFSLDKEYTFEFYQHLLIFHEDEFTIDMGRPIGKVPLAPSTDGQPIKFMSARKDPITGALDSLWSFDIWHESMYPLANKAQTHPAGGI